MRRLLLMTLLLGAAPDDQGQAQRQRLLDAKRAMAVANDRASALALAAERERDAATRARVDESVLAARVDAAAAAVGAAEARVALVEGAEATAQARLAQAQAPAARLLGALAALARRPAIAAVAQPGSVADLVHVRAVLGAQLPVVRARAAGLRGELAEARRLQAGAALAAIALRAGRGDLERQRTALAMLAARHRRDAATLDRRAIGESDRALAMGERARDLVDAMTQDGAAQATVGDLAGLAGPMPRPLAPGAMPLAAAGAGYRLPVAGTLVTGFGEVSAAGVRSRGLSFRVVAGAPVVAPAGGTVRLARPFRSFGTIVVIDHGDGWTSLLTGLADASVHVGETIGGGAPVGRAGTGEEPRVTVELRRRGRPADIAALIG